MATIKQIAELSGVSRGTVDRVLNHRGGVNSQTQKKVLEIAQLLEYQPNKAGIALAAQKKKYKIGVLLFGAENPFFDDVMKGLNQKLEELSIYGCSILSKRIPFSCEAQLAAIDDFLSEGMQALILSPYNDVRIKDKIDILSSQDIPCITVNTDIPESKRIAYVGSDYYKCGQTAGGLMGLITAGKATVGIITGSHRVLCHEERIDGFQDKLSEKFPNIKIAAISENDDDDYRSYDVVKNMLSSHPEIDALYFTAGGVHGGCQAITSICGDHLPKVITFDTVPTTKEMLQNGVITATICQQPELQGATSLALLVDYLVNRTLPEQEYQYMDLSIVIPENL